MLSLKQEVQLEQVGFKDLILDLNKYQYYILKYYKLNIFMI